MINLSDFQPLSIAKIKKFSSTTGFSLKIFSDKVHAILIEEVTVKTKTKEVHSCACFVDVRSLKASFRPDEIVPQAKITCVLICLVQEILVSCR